MGAYVLRKLFHLLPVLLGISVVTFGLINLVPGNPAETILMLEGRIPTEEDVRALEVKLGLDAHLYVRYLRWVRNALSLDLGTSYYTHRPVTEELFSRFPATLELTISATILIVLLSLPIGTLAAVHRNRFFDVLMRMTTLLGVSMPGYWLGLLLMLLFANKWRLLPVMGKGSVKHLILPTITLSMGMMLTYARLLRTSMLEVMKEEFVLVARAKGVKDRVVIMKHVLRNALIPVVTAFGTGFGHLLGGTFIVETIFSWPGMGKFVVDAIFKRDYPVIQGFVLMMACIYVGVNLCVDLVYSVIDPRIRLQGTA
jgi:peptide/nickel transport system permease protein